MKNSKTTAAKTNTAVAKAAKKAGKTTAEFINTTNPEVIKALAVAADPTLTGNEADVTDAQAAAAHKAPAKKAAKPKAPAKKATTKVLNHEQAAEAGVFLDPSEVALVQPAAPAKTHTQIATEAIGFPPATTKPKAPAKPKAPIIHPVVVAPSALSQEAITWRDLSEGARAMFKAAAKCRHDWSGNPPTFEYMSTQPKDKGFLTSLKTKGLLTTQQDGDQPDVFWTNFTPAGEALIKWLEDGGDEPTTLVVDGTKAPAPAKPKTPVADKMAKQGIVITSGTPAKAPKVKAPKVDRAKLRYEAITECMAAVKSDKWRKADYKPMLKHLEATYPALYAKLKTKEKVLAYSTGIVDFCLAACRKLDTKPA